MSSFMKGKADTKVKRKDRLSFVVFFPNIDYELCYRGKYSLLPERVAGIPRRQWERWGR